MSYADYTISNYAQAFHRLGVGILEEVAIAMMSNPERHIKSKERENFRIDNFPILIQSELKQTRYSEKN
jgi:hypothetical protein